MNNSKIVLNLISILFVCLGLNLEASTSLQEKQRLLNKLDMLDAMDFQDAIDAANKCTQRRQFDCTEKKIKKAERFAKSHLDKKELSYARENLESEREMQREEQRQAEEEAREREERRREEERAEEEERERILEERAQRKAEADAQMWRDVYNGINTAGNEILRQQRETNRQIEENTRRAYAEKREREDRDRRRREEAQQERNRQIAAQQEQTRRDRERHTQARQEEIQRERQRERERDAQRERQRQQERERQVLAQQEASRQERERQNRINEARKREYAQAEAKKKEKEPCVGRFESTGPAPKGQCGYVYSDYNKVIRLGEEASKNVFLEPTEELSKGSLKHAIRRNLEKQCKSSGYDFIVQGGTFKHYDLEWKATSCRKVKDGFDSGYLCKGSGSAMCGKYVGRGK